MIRTYGLYTVWVLACLSLIADLYFVEPCCLIWMERICLYPLAFIAGIAAWRGFLGISSYLLPQVILGLGISIYQVVLHKKPEWGFAFCSGCPTSTLVTWISIGVFLCIAILLFCLKRSQ
ncbi:MAG: hypothetical protein JSS32_09515 [Verrucomicrobia bacterium]|nr:hypothetical protein [Verrucomicrobiota bacterium]